MKVYYFLAVIISICLELCLSKPTTKSVSKAKPIRAVLVVDESAKIKDDTLNQLSENSIPDLIVSLNGNFTSDFKMAIFASSGSRTEEILVMQKPSNLDFIKDKLNNRMRRVI
jgi:hypothetical protein